MKPSLMNVLLISGLVATAACSKKPKDLPPPPPTDTAPATPAPVDTGSATPTNVPGSNADFLAQAGSDRVFFALDSYSLDSQSQSTLDAQAAWLSQYPNVTITIEGHADERGTREYNLALGDRRANAAKNYLAAKGIAVSRMSTISYGKERPAAEGSNEDAWAQNRRAVTVLVNPAG